MAISLTPQYHICANGEYFEREPYLNPNGETTRFIGLSNFENKTKQKWFYGKFLSDSQQ
jgi:hypothetical protein